MWFPSATLTQSDYNICHYGIDSHHIHMAITSANNISGYKQYDNNICHNKHNKLTLPSVNKRLAKHTNPLAKLSKIVNVNFPHTPSKVGVLEIIIFPIHQKKACWLDWQKLVFFEKNWFCSWEIEFFIPGEPSEQDSNNLSGNNTRRDTTKDKYKENIVIPYTRGVGKSIKNICRKYGIQTHFKGNRTIKNILVKPIDKDPLEIKGGATYWYQCGEAHMQWGVHRRDIQDLWGKT